jgi:phage-related protein
MISKVARNYILLLAAALQATVLHASKPETVTLVVPDPIAEPVRFGSEQLRAAFANKGVDVRVASHPSSASVEVLVATDDALALRLKVPQTPESYAITVASRNRIVVQGGDTIGLMYGMLDLAEQVTNSNAGASVAALMGTIKPTVKSPFLAIRGINMFLTTQDIDNPSSALWTYDYWHDFFDMMARDRYNLLDLHGPCDAVTLTFPNAYSYFVSLPDFPQIGVGSARAEKNMALLQRVIRMAADRGIKVAYMNYEEAPPIGAWQTRRFGVDERWTPVVQKVLAGPELVKYTREAVASFLNQLPGLWMFGFRIGESGETEDFFKATYLQALKSVSPQLNVYLRTWIADPAKVRELGRLLPQHLYIEIKYNGEHLGLPYQAALGGREYSASGSYENYTNYPKDYLIIWQIRAHGTHRVFYWMSPEFARRTVQSCKFGAGVGFSMEQMNSYSPEEDYLHNNVNVDHHFFRWPFQRYWTWNLVWGRMAYDPDTPDEIFVNAFIDHFGPEAGPFVFKALVESSKIVPFIYAYHNIGLDHQDFAPELEVGDHALGVPSRMWQGTRLVPFGGNNDDFLRVTPLDRTAMADPETYVEMRLKGLADGKMTPWEAADYLDRAATLSQTIIDHAALMHPESPKNFDCIRMDIEAVGWLARYYRDRIRSATHLALYRSTYSHEELVQAYDNLNRAVDAWDHLSEITEQHFGHIPEYIRMGVKNFHWRDERQSLEADLGQLDQLERQFSDLSARDWSRAVILGHVPPARVMPGETLNLTVTFPGAAPDSRLELFYRTAQDPAYVGIALTQVNNMDHTWTGVIPADKVLAGSLDYYFQAHSGKGGFGSYGSTLDAHLPYHVLVNSNRATPVISHTLPDTTRRDLIALTVKIHASAAVSEVFVFYKPIPAADPWIRTAMHPLGDDTYGANLPLTSDGILYYFEAADTDGNAANYPDFLQQTPYFVVDGWNPDSP